MLSHYEYIRYSYSVKISFLNIFVFVFGQEFDIRVTLSDVVDFVVVSVVVVIVVDVDAAQVPHLSCAQS